MNVWRKAIDRLVSVKSFVTIIMTVAFFVLALRGNIGQEFLTVFTVVISFYFGTQAGKTENEEKYEK